MDLAVTGRALFGYLVGFASRPLSLLGGWFTVGIQCSDYHSNAVVFSIARPINISGDRLGLTR